MPDIRATSREAKHVRLIYRNPQVRTRAGKLARGSVTFDVDGKEFTLHTVYGAAATLGRSFTFVQHLLESGKLRGHRLGRDWLVLDADLRSFIEEQRPKIQKRFGAFLQE